MVRIRLHRMGRRKRPFYRIVAASSQSPRDGRFIEALGHYDPKATTAEILVRADRVKYWVERGAQVSATVKALMRRSPSPQPSPSKGEGAGSV